MSNRLFGTDGMRGLAGQEPLTVSTLTRLGQLLGQRLIRPAYLLDTTDAKVVKPYAPLSLKACAPPAQMWK